jgi:hypothetical protein
MTRYLSPCLLLILSGCVETKGSLPQPTALETTTIPATNPAPRPIVTCADISGRLYSTGDPDNLRARIEIPDGPRAEGMIRLASYQGSALYDSLDLQLATYPSGACCTGVATPSRPPRTVILSCDERVLDREDRLT